VSHTRTIARCARPSSGCPRLRIISIAIGAVVTTFSTGSAQAYEIGTGNPDLSLRWDNTLRYNHATRVERRDDKIGNSAVSDEGTYKAQAGQGVGAAAV